MTVKHIVSEAEKIGVIVNPRAARGRAGRRWSEMSSALTARLGPVTARFTSVSGAGIALARDFLKEGCNVLVAVGGDGTVNEVVNGMLEHAGPAPVSARLGILTLGTGGDLPRSLGIPSKLEDAVEVLAAGVPVNLDVGSAKFTGHDGAARQRYFLNVASFGMGGEVATHARHSLRILGGRMAFLWATLRAFLAYRAPRVRLEFDGEPKDAEFRVLNVAVGNGCYHGGGMHPCPTALPNDGVLEVTVIESMGMLRLARDLHVLYSHDVYRHPKVHHFRARRLMARSDETTEIEIDGEALGRLPLDITILPGRLPVMVPGTSPVAARS